MPKDSWPESPLQRCVSLYCLCCSNKYFLLLFFTLAVGFYWFGWRPVSAVQNCHAAAQQNAKIMIQQRLQLDPQNPQLQRAAQAGMIADEDYTSAYRNCLRSEGYGIQ